MFTFLDLQAEVKRRALRNQSGTEYDTETKNIINTSMFRIAREAKWRCLRRKTFFNTVTSYTSGSNYAFVTSSSTAVSISATAANWWTDKIEIGRRIKFGTSGWYYTIRAFNSNTNLVLDMPYRGDTSTGTTYEISPQEEYNLPVQVDHRAFLWHEDFGYPYKMFFIPDQTFLNTQMSLREKNISTHYRMWGEDTVMAQVPTATPLMIVSSNAGDSNTSITILGKVAGYPDSEVVTLGGITSTKTVYEFDSVERVAKNSSTLGRVTITSSRGNYTIAIIPAGNTTATIKYSKIQLYPLPNRSFPINVYYYKDPYELVNDNDIPELSPAFNEAIILLSVAKIKYQDSQAEGDKWYAMFNDEVKNLRMTNVDKFDWKILLQRPNQERTDPFVTKSLLYRQVGPYFGSTSR